MDYNEEDNGRMLSESWTAMRHDKLRRYNLFAGLSKIILSLGRVPLPRIGSHTINDEGVVSLTNRPLTLMLQQLENEGIPTNITRERTYTTVEPYLLDTLALHDSRLSHQPNAANDAADCRGQMVALTAMRSVFHHCNSQDFRTGPFYFSLTDIHASNIFVDPDWKITCLIDLKWACSLPVELEHPPHWLTSRNVDQLDGEYLAEFNEVREEFMDVFEKEEKRFSCSKNCTPLRAHTMRRGWDTGKFFYFHAMYSTVGMFTLFWQHIQPRFAPAHCSDKDFDRIYAPYWKSEADKFVSTKEKEKADYDERLETMFKEGDPSHKDEASGGKNRFICAAYSRILLNLPTI